MNTSLRLRREEQKETYGEAIFSLPHLDEMALNIVYYCRISTALEDKKCFPYYLTYPHASRDPEWGQARREGIRSYKRTLIWEWVFQNLLASLILTEKRIYLD